MRLSQLQIWIKNKHELIISGMLLDCTLEPNKQLVWLEDKRLGNLRLVRGEKQRKNTNLLTIIKDGKYGSIMDQLFIICGSLFIWYRL